MCKTQLQVKSLTPQLKAIPAAKNATTPDTLHICVDSCFTFLALFSPLSKFFLELYKKYHIWHCNFQRAYNEIHLSYSRFLLFFFNTFLRLRNILQQHYSLTAHGIKSFGLLLSAFHCYSLQFFFYHNFQWTALSFVFLDNSGDKSMTPLDLNTFVFKRLWLVACFSGEMHCISVYCLNNDTYSFPPMVKCPWRSSGGGNKLA